MSDCPVTTQALDCNIHLCLYCWLFWGWSDVGVVYYSCHNRRMFRSTIWKWVELSNSLCNTLCRQPCLGILIPALLNCLNQTSHSLCNKYRVTNINESRKKKNKVQLVGQENFEVVPKFLTLHKNNKTVSWKHVWIKNQNILCSHSSSDHNIIQVKESKTWNLLTHRASRFQNSLLPCTCT